MEEIIENSKMKKIKSLYIVKRIFLLLYQNKKLDLICYSNYWQKKLKLDIEDYKIVSGKYKIIDNNKFGREYLLNTNKKIFEGEYLNKKRNGKGKEYHYNGKLKFKGEFINGKKITGKEYDNYGYLISIIKEGKGEEYYKNKELKFKGEYLNGKRWNGIVFNYYGNKKFPIKYGKGRIKEYNNNN